MPLAASFSAAFAAIFLRNVFTDTSLPPRLDWCVMCFQACCFSSSFAVGTIQSVCPLSLLQGRFCCHLPQLRLSRDADWKRFRQKHPQTVGHTCTTQFRNPENIIAKRSMKQKEEDDECGGLGRKKQSYWSPGSVMEETEKHTNNNAKTIEATISKKSRPSGEKCLFIEEQSPAALLPLLPLRPQQSCL